MKKAIIYIMLVLVTSIATLLITAYLSEEDVYVGEIKVKLYSSVLQQERELLIHLPFNYDSTKKYPVFYVLDGSSLDRNLDQTLDVLAKANCAREGIVVGIPNMTADNRSKNLVPPFMKTDPEDALSQFGNGDVFLSFIENEVKPFIENKYSCNGHNTLVGNSRGGLLTLYSLINNPTLFQTRLIFSAPVWRQNSILINKTASFIKEQGSQRGRIFISVGEKETNKMRHGFEKLKQEFESNDSTNRNWKMITTQGADHQTNAILSLPLALKYWTQTSGID
ncbi:alpha/beta hydrolase [Chryseotalea sanaruensis]|uniref:Alpha/beta hydrolase n=1 Tax=Chryseotalea sanaruensis TaxID=2482724 RepID=A0A401U805_9BACT|nr:alpha/beta hydrolase-fold protein [Chryseotalea sanaruensis]GCC51023.1 alpha/beta hydrolase [Chryseotalea sanaruensis]